MRTCSTNSHDADTIIQYVVALVFHFSLPYFKMQVLLLMVQIVRIYWYAENKTTSVYNKPQEQVLAIIKPLQLLRSWCIDWYADTGGVWSVSGEYRYYVNHCKFFHVCYKCDVRPSQLLEAIISRPLSGLNANYPALMPPILGMPLPLELHSYGSS